MVIDIVYMMYVVTYLTHMVLFTNQKIQWKIYDKELWKAREQMWFRLVKCILHADMSVIQFKTRDVCETLTSSPS